MQAGYDVINHIRDFANKLVLEKRMTMEEAATVHSMIQSEDKGDWVLAIAALEQRRPGKFMKGEGKPGPKLAGPNSWSTTYSLSSI